MNHPKKLTVSNAAWAIEVFYRIPGNGMGGVLHVVLDDGNWALRNIQWCMGQASKAGDFKALEICLMLLQLTPSQRRRLWRYRDKITDKDIENLKSGLSTGAMKKYQNQVSSLYKSI